MMCCSCLWSLFFESGVLLENGSSTSVSLCSLSCIRKCFGKEVVLVGCVLWLSGGTFFGVVQVVWWYVGVRFVFWWCVVFGG